MGELSILQVAEILGTRPRDVDALIDRGALVAYRREGGLVVRRSDLERSCAHWC